MKTALWIIAFAQVYNIVEAWIWSLHWRLKGKKEFETRTTERKLESILALYDSSDKDKNGK
jgi:hypothetical protein